MRAPRLGDEIEIWLAGEWVRGKATLAVAVEGEDGAWHCDGGYWAPEDGDPEEYAWRWPGSFDPPTVADGPGIVMGPVPSEPPDLPDQLEALAKRLRAVKAAL